MALAQSIGGAANAAVDTIKGFLGGARYDQPSRTKTTDDTAVLTELEDKYKKAKDDRRQYEREWQTSLAFLKAQQWLEWDRVRQTLYLPPAPPWRVRSTTNLIQPIFRTILGKISAQKTQAKVRAVNETPEAAEDARAQDQLLDYLWDRCDSEAAVLDALKWAIVAGTGIHHPCWDKSIGEELTNPDTVEGPPDEMGQPTQMPHPEAGQPVREPGPDGQPNPEGNVVHMGDIDHTAVSPFEFFPEPLAQRIEDMEYVFFVKVRPASYVNRKFGTELEDQAIPSDEYAMNTIESDQNQSSVAKGIPLFEYWQRPNASAPEGRYVVYVKDKILFNGPNPYPKEPIPFIAVREATVPGRFWGRSVIADLVPLQQTYNKIKSQMLETTNSISRPKWAVVKGALDPGKTISTAPAEVITYNPIAGAFEGGRPTKIAGGDIPAGMFNLLARIQSEFYEVAGIHDFSKGLSGLGGVRAGFALKMLLEEDSTRTGILKRNLDESIIKLEKAKLHLAKQFYIEPRTIAVVGKDSTAEVAEFYAERIPDDVDVHIIASGGLPESLAARQEYVLELIKTPVSPQSLLPDPRVALKLLGLGDVEGVYEDMNRDIRQAERENEKMMVGTAVEAHDYDNHVVHGQQHDGTRKGEQYEQVVATNPAIGQVFATHIAMHKLLIQQAMVAATPPPAPPSPPHTHPAPPGPPSVPQVGPPAI